MEKNNNKTVLTYAIIGILLITFGVYSATMNYADAISSTTYTLGGNYSVFGGDYRAQSDTWFFTSGTNNTIIELDNNSTVFDTGSYSDGACADAHVIKVINGGQHLALLCNNASAVTFALQIRTSSSPYTLVDEEAGWANTEDIYNMIEWVGGDRLYVLNSGTGSPLVYMFNLNNINSTLSPMFQGSVGASNCNVATGITLSEDNFQAYVSCNRVSTSVIGFATIELTTFTSSVFTAVTATTSTGATQIDYNSDENSVAITVADANDDIYVWDLDSASLTSSNTNICGDPISPQWNENTGQLYIVCMDANIIAVYDTVTSESIGSFNTETFSATAPFGSNNVPIFVWEDSIGSGYLAYAFIDGNHGNLFNFVTGIEDSTNSSGASGTVVICYVVQGTNQQFCQEYDVDEDGNVILDSIIGGVNPRNITATSGELFCSLGLTDCDNPDITTNGTGMFMLLIIVIVSYAFIIAIHHFAHVGIIHINPMFVLLIGIIDVTIAFFLGWIPDYIFYSVIVLLVGLGGFGLYRIIRGA